MKVLHVCPYFYPAISFGGVSSYTFNIVRELGRRGHEITVYTSDAMSSRRRVDRFHVDFGANLSVKYFNNTIPPIGGLYPTLGMLSSLRTEICEFDLVHMHEYRTLQNVIAGHLAVQNRVPYMLQAHGTLPRIGQRGLSKMIFDLLFGNHILVKAKVGLPLSNFEAQQYQSVRGWKQPLEIVPNTVNLNEFSQHREDLSFRKSLGFDAETPLILFLGRLNRIKALDVLLYSFRRVLETQPESHLVIAGPDDGELGNLNRLSHYLGIQKNVIFTGLLSKEKKSALIAADLVVVPSWYEMFSTTILEAFASGTPVIASKVGSTPEFVLPGENGFLFNPGNITELADSILQLVLNPAVANRMGMSGRKLVEEKYNVSTVVSKLEHIYRRIAP